MSMGGEIMEELYDGMRDNLRAEVRSLLKELTNEMDNFQGDDEEDLGILEGQIEAYRNCLTLIEKYFG
jgi:hypothetical protein